jgi:hypothetical protein
VSAILALLIVVAATIILTSNLALADWKASFQQKPEIATPSASQSGTASIMAFNKIGSGSSSSTAKDPYEHISSNNINPLQQFGTIRDGSPVASRTNTNNVDASAYTTITTGNTGSKLTTRTIQPMIITSEPSQPQQQQQNPISTEIVTPQGPSQVTTEIVTPQGPSQVTTVTTSLAGQITCKPTEVLRNSKCSPQTTTCDPIGMSQDSKCSTRPLYYHHMFMSIRSFRHR